MNVGRFMLGGVFFILAGGFAFVFRARVAAFFDRFNAQLPGKLSTGKPSPPAALILPSIASIVIGVVNVVQSFP
ncbi:hypothetical protein KXS11_08785 [Plantibacter flavus]|uniref:hypothetical protein n=1 Tax=Plantibacter flavus TaxID=150123 RepID=UPI003F1563E3